jgi:arylsulfatase A-like enzyme
MTQAFRTALYFTRINAYALLAASTLLAHAATADDQPNFIIVMTDDQGWGDAGYAGHPRLKTPHLDAMAASGLRFDRFYATASMCSPTRVATLTGRNNLRFGIGGPISQGEDHLPKEEITIAEALAPLGYVSGHFGKWHVGDIVNEEDSTNIMHPGMAGFAEWFSTRNVLPTFDPYLGKFDITQHYYHNGCYVSEDEGIRGDDSRIVMDAALGFIQDRANDKKPFFAFICFHAVHYPLGLIPEYSEPYTDITDKTTKNYYSNITAIDAAVGRLRGALRESNLSENTLLWFCSDNGPNLKGDNEAGPGSKGPYRGCKGQLYEGGIRVPGLLEWPGGISQPRVIDTPVVTSDFFPTFVDLAGGKLPARPYDGISLVPLLKGEADSFDRNICSSTRGWLAIQNEKYKLVRPKGKTSSFELYDMEDDPHETKNISAAHPDVTRELRATLEAWIAECEASERGEDYIEEEEHAQ